MHVPLHYAPDGKVLIGGNDNFGIIWMSCTQNFALRGVEQLFDGKFAVDDRDYHAAVGGGYGAIYNQQVTVKNAEIAHGVPSDPHEEGRLSMLD